jgi:hypothetical protein
MTETYDKPPEAILFWQCRQRIDTKTKCKYLNNKGNMTCNGCKSKRGKGDVALDQYKRKVGVLQKVEGVVEYWQHYELNDPVQQGGTGV